MLKRVTSGKCRKIYPQITAKRKQLGIYIFFHPNPITKLKIIHSGSSGTSFSSVTVIWIHISAL